MDHRIKQRVLDVIRDTLGIDDESVIRGVSRQDWAKTSLDQMTLFISLEDEFDRTIPQESVAHIKTVEEIINYIQNELTNSTNRSA